MILRDAEACVKDQAGKFPVVSITGPRQSGKTTLAKNAFPSYEYVSFENPDVRSLFNDDPRGFLGRHAGKVIFDEAQRVPELFSYLQETVDSGNEPGRFVVTGSQNFLLSKAVGQSLAGRVALFTLLPLSCSELFDAELMPVDAAAWVWRGGYPRIYDSKLEPSEFFPGYIETYLQRDVREELGVRSLAAFKRFLQLCALRCGEQLNVTALASDCGVDVKTARGWLSVLEASHIVYLLQPFFSNRGKRLVKRPKLYFLDTGLACSLIGLEAVEDVRDSEYFGHLFEAAVVSEVLKSFYARGRVPQLSFWRDAGGREVDLVVERGLRAVRALEVKSGITYRSKHFAALVDIAQHELGLDPTECAVVYGGDVEADTSRGRAAPYWRVSQLLAF